MNTEKKDGHHHEVMILPNAEVFELFGFISTGSFEVQ